jgi:hypothetical protein
MSTTKDNSKFKKAIQDGSLVASLKIVNQNMKRMYNGVNEALHELQSIRKEQSKVLSTTSSPGIVFHSVETNKVDNKDDMEALKKEIQRLNEQLQAQQDNSSYVEFDVFPKVKPVATANKELLKMQIGFLVRRFKEANNYGDNISGFKELTKQFAFNSTNMHAHIYVFSSSDDLYSNFKLNGNTISYDNVAKIADTGFVYLRASGALKGGDADKLKKLIAIHFSPDTTIDEKKRQDWIKSDVLGNKDIKAEMRYASVSMTSFAVNKTVEVFGVKFDGSSNVVLEKKIGGNTPEKFEKLSDTEKEEAKKKSEEDKLFSDEVTNIETFFKNL